MTKDKIINAHPLDNNCTSSDINAAARQPRSFGVEKPPAVHVPFVVDFDELNALASTFEDYPSPEDILHLDKGDNQQRISSNSDSLISPAASSFKKLMHHPEASSNGYVYSIPDNPIQLPVAA